MKYLLLILIQLIVFVESASISLCGTVNSTWANDSSVPEIIVLREHNLEDSRMKEAMSDVDCWLQKNFKVNQSYSVPTKGDPEMICYKIATVPIKANQLMVVATEGSSAENCTISLYGPIPNILNIKMFIDGTKNDSAKRIEMTLRNTGGFFGVQFELHRKSVATKIQKSVAFMIELSKKTMEYAKLVPFWKPTIEVPSGDYEVRQMTEERSDLMRKHISISWLLIASVMPMFVFGIVVSCYIVIHPRGGLTYTDEEVDFTIQEVDSNSRVNTARDKSLPLLSAAPMSLGIPAALEPDLRTALEPLPDPALYTAKDSEIHTDVTVLSEVKSAETVRMMIVAKGGDTMSLKTGREK
ncbi:unnamed protein product [Caenorhabditis sp. 36 PRJEB53466]|nr:unnamed protein product [Caenorhabditis sp. 36 PRJEB53466]